MKLKKLIQISLFSCLVLNTAAYADTAAPYKTPKHPYQYKHKYKDRYKDVVYKDVWVRGDHFEGIGALGPAKLHAGNSTVNVTSAEQDTLRQTNANSWSTFAGQLGAGYIHYFPNPPQTGQVAWFTAFEPQLNLYSLVSNSINGQVWRFNSPAFNQLNFDMPFRSLRVMLDGALTVAEWERLSVYAKAGIGFAWNRLSYSDRDNGSGGNDCTNQGLNLNAHTNRNFVWEAGPGVLFAMNARTSVSFEYLYTDLGRVQTAASGNTGSIPTPAVSAAKFRLKSQTALLGLHIAV